MRILVGTMSTGENERERSRASVQRQTHPALEHLLIENLPNREAHEKLYGTFLARRDEFDLLVKVDADMVLRSDELFAGLVEVFAAQPSRQLLELKVHDWYTDRSMSGLNTYRNTIRWAPTGDVVFTDRFGLGGGRASREVQRKLAPAAWHCPDPSPYQAFHFGVHRGVKAAVAAKRGLHETAYQRCREVERVWRHFCRAGDVRLGLAALGGELGMQGVVGGDELDYHNPAVGQLFTKYAQWDRAALAAEVRGRRGGEGATWPWWVRMERRRGGRRLAIAGRCVVPVPARKVGMIVRRRLVPRTAER